MIKGGTIWFLVNLIAGLYFVNLGFAFVAIPFMEQFNDWIIIAGGVLIVLNGVMFLKRDSRRY